MNYLFSLLVLVLVSVKVVIISRCTTLLFVPCFDTYIRYETKHWPTMILVPIDIKTDCRERRRVVRCVVVLLCTLYFEAF